MSPTATIFLIATALIALGGCTTAASLRLQEPPPGWALWEGTWDSEEYGLVGGQVAVLLPTPITSADHTFDMPGAIHYGALTLYRPGRTVKVDFTATVTSNDVARGGNEAAPIAAPGLRLHLLSKGGLGPPGQVITYEADLSDGDIIQGTYRSSDPFDTGHFRLKRRPAG